MQHDDGRKYGNLSVVRGGKAYGRLPALTSYTTAEFELDRDLQTLFVALESRVGTVPSRGIQEIREGRQAPWRVMVRRLREAINADVPESQLYEITHRVNQYIASKSAQRRRMTGGRAA